MQLLDLPHTEARAALSTGAPVYLPVNPVEYHGPHLSLRNDALVSAGLARDLHARLSAAHPDWAFLEASPIEQGFEPCPGPGTRVTPYAALGRTVREAVRALLELGCKRVVLMTFHGQPLHAWALEEGVREAAAAGAQALSPLNLVLEEMLAVDGARYAEAFAHVEDPAERAEMIAGLGTDFHAGFFETSLALHYAPASVAQAFHDLPPCPPVAPDPALARMARAARVLGKERLAQELSLAAAGKGWTSLRPFPGYTGRPHRASAAAGAFFARTIADRYAARAEEVFAGRARSPEPILGWARAATLGGRVAA